MATTAWSIRDLSIPPSLRFAVAVGCISVTMTTCLAVGFRLLAERLVVPRNPHAFNGNWLGALGTGTMATLYLAYMATLAALLILHEKPGMTSVCWTLNGLVLCLYLGLAGDNFSVLLFGGNHPMPSP